MLARFGSSRHAYRPNDRHQRMAGKECPCQDATIRHSAAWVRPSRRLTGGVPLPFWKAVPCTRTKIIRKAAYQLSLRSNKHETRANCSGQSGMTGLADSPESLVFATPVTARKHRASGPSSFRIVPGDSVTPVLPDTPPPGFSTSPEAGVTGGRRRLGDELRLHGLSSAQAHSAPTVNSLHALPP